MDRLAENFDLHATIASISQALKAVFCHMVFDAALHGLAMSILVAILGFLLFRQGKRFGKPLLSAAKRLAIICGVLSVPGVIALVTSGKLPEAGVFNFNSVGFIVFWTLLCLHFSAEEINYQFFIEESAKNAPVESQIPDAASTSKS
jgi:hypothetical protein